MTREAGRLCHVHPMSGGLGSRPLKDDGWEAITPRIALSALIMRVSNPWGDAPGCNDVAPLALKHTQAACGLTKGTRYNLPGRLMKRRLRWNAHNHRCSGQSRVDRRKLPALAGKS